MKKKQRVEQMRREKDRKELDDLLRDSSEGEVIPVGGFMYIHIVPEHLIISDRSSKVQGTEV